jgi:hypothetical protein
MSEEVKNCFECGKQISGKSIETFGSTFHYACWTCMKCKTELGEVYFPITGESGNVVFFCMGN